jgi:hypothetical protein
VLVYEAHYCSWSEIVMQLNMLRTPARLGLGGNDARWL